MSVIAHADYLKGNIALTSDKIRLSSVLEEWLNVKSENGKAWQASKAIPMERMTRRDIVCTRKKGGAINRSYLALLLRKQGFRYTHSDTLI